MTIKAKTTLAAAALAAIVSFTMPAVAGHSTGTWLYAPYGLNPGAVYGGQHPGAVYGGQPRGWTHGAPMAQPHGWYGRRHEGGGYAYSQDHPWRERYMMQRGRWD